VPEQLVGAIDEVNLEVFRHGAIMARRNHRPRRPTAR